MTSSRKRLLFSKKVKLAAARGAGRPGERAVDGRAGGESRVVRRDASQLGVSSSSECSISVDGALIASIDVAASVHYE